MILSGNSHPDLARDIASSLMTNLVDATVGEFPDKETKVQIKENVRDKDVFIIQPTGPPTNQNLMELLIMTDALQRSSAARITAVTPYFGYSRQDRKDESRVPITAKLVTNLFKAAGVDRILVVDLHAHQLQGFTDQPLDHLYASNTFVKALRGELDKPVVVAPDIGAAKMAISYAGKLDTQWAIVNKARISSESTRVDAIVGQKVVGRTVLIVDDIISTGGSILSASEVLKGEGATQVCAAITHGILCGDAVDRIENSEFLDHLYISDSVPGNTSSKIGRITIAPLLARAIKHINEGSSLRELFELDQ